MAQALRAGLRNGGIRRGGLRPGLGNGSLFAVAPLDLFFARNRTLDPRVTFTRASSGTYVDSQGVLRTAATNEPRFNHNPTTGESLGLLVEEARTNLLLNSATLSTQNVTVTTAAHTLSFTGTGTITLSGASTAGPLVGTGAGEGNRVSLTFTPTAGTLTLTVSGTVSNAQLEVGSFRTSYIPTTAATATRSADVASITGANFSSWYNQTQGTVYVDASSYMGAAAVTRGVVSIDGAVGDVYRLFRQGDLQPVAQTFVSSVAQSTFGFGATWSTSAAQRLAYAYAANDFGGSANGGAAQTDSSGTIPTTNTLNVGSLSGGNYFGGTIRRLTYWPQRLANSTLQAITR